MMRRTGAAGLVAAGMLLIGAAPGQAQELAGATYLGEHKGGHRPPQGVIRRHSAGGVSGNQQARPGLRGRPVAPFGAPPSPGLPIENHAFAGALSPGLSVSGSFTAPGVASGSFDLSPVPPGTRGPIRRALTVSSRSGVLDRCG